MAQTRTHDRFDPRVLSLVGLALVALVACAAYLPSLGGHFLWDDDAHVTRPELQSAHGLYRIWFDFGSTQQYYPLLHSAFWAEHTVFGDDPLGYRIVNLLLHLGAACLVYAILRKLQIPGALLAAAIFALHPVQVETVAWVTEQKNTLSAVFYLAAMLVYLYFDESRDRATYALAFALFVLGVLTKTVTATLPAALLVVFWWSRGQLSWRRDVVPLLPFFILGAVGGLVTAWFERNLIGAEGEPYALSLVQRTLLAGRIIWFYLGKLVWPGELIFFYPRWTVDPTQVTQWLYLLAAIATTIGLWMIRRRTRAPLAAWLFFVGTLFPVLGFLNVYPFRFSYVADHFQYLACLGPIVLASAGVARAVARIQVPARWIAGGACVVLLGVLATLTGLQSRAYADRTTLWQTTIQRNPDCWVAYNNLGMVLFEQGRKPEAMQHFELALRSKPDYELALNNLGCLLLNDGRVQEAMQRFDRALAARPNYVDAHYNLGEALQTLGRREEAVTHYRRALAVQPDFATARFSLGAALVALGRPEEGITELEQAVKLRPNNIKAYGALARALAQTSRPQEAIQRYEQGLRVDPNSAELWGDVGVLKAKLGDMPQAIAAVQTALQLARAQGNTALAARYEQMLQQAPAAPDSTPLPAPALPPSSP